eukprot:c7014_g1_i1.p1 GENE.c7014_g1_i1~~c7014_g1_i1.p1  ORF type:complete len:302 (-),score=67.53 c7014_g1_i1:204-1109(-)
MGERSFLSSTTNRFAMSTQQLDSSLLALKAVFAALTVVTCIGGGLLPKKFAASPTAMAYANSFSAGVLIGAAFLHLLADAVESWVTTYGSQVYSWHLFCTGAGVICCVGISSLSGHKHSHGGGSHVGEEAAHSDARKTEEQAALLGDHGHDEGSTTLPNILALTMSFECFFTGLAMGLESTAVGAVAVFIAIITHVWAEAFVLVLAAVKAGMDESAQRRLLLLFCLASPLGVAIGMSLDSVGAATITFQIVIRCFCAGLFLYVSMIEIIPGEMDSPHGHSITKLMMITNGFAFMALVAIAA